MIYKQANPDDDILARRIKRGVYAFFDAELHKRCLVCKEYWPADTEFFITQRPTKMVLATHAAPAAASKGNTTVHTIKKTKWRQHDRFIKQN